MWIWMPLGSHKVWIKFDHLDLHVLLNLTYSVYMIMNYFKLTAKYNYCNEFSANMDWKIANKYYMWEVIFYELNMSMSQESNYESVSGFSHKVRIRVRLRVSIRVGVEFSVRVGVRVTSIFSQVKQFDSWLIKPSISRYITEFSVFSIITENKNSWITESWYLEQTRILIFIVFVWMDILFYPRKTYFQNISVLMHSQIRLWQVSLMHYDSSQRSSHKQFCIYPGLKFFQHINDNFQFLYNRHVLAASSAFVSVTVN